MLIDDVAESIDEARRSNDRFAMADPMVAVSKFIESDGVVIDAGGIWNYLRDQGKTMDVIEAYVREHLYVLFPPTSYSWVEWRDFQGNRYGALCVFRNADTLVSQSRQGLIPGWVADKNPDSMIDVGFFMSQGKKNVGYLPFVTANFLAKDGTIVASDDGSMGLVGKASSDVELTDEHCLMGAFIQSIVLFTFSMLNIKNVVRREHRADEKLQRKRIKNGRRPLVKYYTLEVEVPGKRFIGADDRTATEPGTSSRPLHLVRGHLADYRDGKGLFGKYKGVYWMPAHFRGDAENGVIKKRYRVVTGE